MKKILILFLLTIITTSAFAQMRRGRSIGTLKINWYKTGWFLEANAGTRFLGQTSDIADMKVRPSFNGGIGYMFNEKIGVKGRIDAHLFRTEYSGFTDDSYSMSGSAEIVLRLIQLFSVRNSRDFALNFHAGGGITALANPSYKDHADAMGKKYEGKLFRADNMGHLIVGLMPQYHINSRLSINLDISHFTQFEQYRTYDIYNKVEAKDITGILSTTIGLTFRP